MVFSGKYGKVFISKIGENEPVFILRAHDKLALPGFEMYKRLVSQHGSPMTESLKKQVEVLRNWSGPKKTPD